MGRPLRIVAGGGCSLQIIDEVVQVGSNRCKAVG